MKMAPRERNLLVATLAVALLAGTWAFLAPQRAEWKDYQDRREDLEDRLAKAERMLGFKPQYSNKQALVRNYEWYVEHLSEFAGKSGVSHRVPWKQGLLAVAKHFF